MAKDFGRDPISIVQQFDPGAEIIGEDKGATTALNRAQLARVDRMIECHAADAGDGACLGDGEGQRFVHFHLAIGSLDVRATVLACSRAVAKGIGPTGQLCIPQVRQVPAMRLLRYVRRTIGGFRMVSSEILGKPAALSFSPTRWHS